MSQELKPTTRGDENVETAEMFLARVGYSDSRVHSSVAIAILMEDYSRAQLERTNAALLGALKRLATEMDYVHEAADMVRQGADVNLVLNLVRSSDGQEALKQARAAIAEAENHRRDQMSEIDVGRNGGGHCEHTLVTQFMGMSEPQGPRIVRPS